MSKKILKYIPKYEFELLAMLTSSSLYQLIYLLNEEMNLVFSVDESLKISQNKLSKEQEFCVYTCENDSGLIVIRLICNKSSNGFLIEELRNIDYLMHISGEDSTSFTNQLLSSLKQSSVIQGVFAINPEDLASKQKLIF